MGRRISFQGELGAYSHEACRQKFPDYEAVPCYGFEEAIAAVHDEKADLAMLPVDNSTHGRVADIHRLLPESGLHIVGEHFLRVHAQMMGVPGSSIEQIKTAVSHPVLLTQVKNYLRSKGIKPVIGADTAGSARTVAEAADPTQGALGSAVSAEIYGLEILEAEVEDFHHNTTRFLVCSREPARPSSNHVMTSFVFRVRNIPAALYKAMGGFATNGVNMVKLESYMLDGSFTATQFYADIEGDQHDPNVVLALEELDYFTDYLSILGSYDAAPFRHEN